MTTQNFNPKDLAETIRETMKPQIETIGSTPVALIPKGMEAVSLKKFTDEYRQKPERRKGVVALDRVNSLIDITNRFKSESSVIFADAAISGNAISASVQTIFNYHPSGKNNEDADNADHSAIYKFPTARDFDYWMSLNQKPMEQSTFAAFLEERHLEMRVANESEKNIIDGLKPKFADPLEILELSKDLEIYSTETVKNKNKLSSGETELKFTTEHSDADGKPIQIPDFFVIELPIFEGGSAERLIVRLRYRLQNGKINWFYSLYRIDMTLNNAFHTACAEIQEQTGLPLFFGKPE